MAVLFSAVALLECGGLPLWTAGACSRFALRGSLLPPFYGRQLATAMVLPFGTAASRLAEKRWQATALQNLEKALPPGYLQSGCWWTDFDSYRLSKRQPDSIADNKSLKK